MTTKEFRESLKEKKVNVNVDDVDKMSSEAKEKKRHMDYDEIKEENINSKIVLLFLKAQQGNTGWNRDKVAKYLGMTTDRFRKTLDKLAKEGRVIKDGRGQKATYVLVETKAVSGFELNYRVSDLYLPLDQATKLLFIYLRSFEKRLKITTTFFDKQRYFRCANSLMEKDLGMTQMTINKYMKVIEEAGLVSIVRVSNGDGSHQRWIKTR